MSSSLSRRQTLAAGLALPALWTSGARAQVPVLKFGYLADPSHEAMLWPLRNGKVPAPAVKIETTALEVAALIQATAARSYDIIETAAIAVPRARERGLDLRIIGTGLRYSAKGEGADIFVKKGSALKSATDLKGRKLAVYAIGSAGTTLARIALQDVYKMNVAQRGGDIEFVEMPPTAMPAALASGRVDAALLIHAQAYQARQTGEFVSIARTAGDMTERFGVRMVSAVLAGYGEKLDAQPTVYQDALRALRASLDYALQNPNEVFPAVGKETGTDPAFFSTWFAEYSELPITLIPDDVKAIELLWQKSAAMGILSKLPPLRDAFWDKVYAG